ncbi:putative bifunctional diguanylate cyclase/phosphodiesterase [Pannonibacter phragmitetus]|uniref:putative bifunctional diguanylate cyclase/phosphodiesterase n=1 Tax=Pannonibacter phragmitetus TaxID=121719 RepID=UPI003D2F0738
MKQLADGDPHVTVEDTGRADEIGQMAAAMRTFVSYERERHALHGKLQELAFSDSLTGLANRASFQDRLQCELDRAAADGTHCALIVVDLDRFKAINDTMGHAAGDAVLIQTARRIEEAFGACAFVGRLAGDEFFVVLPDLPDVDAAMAQANQLVEAMRHPFMVEDAVLQVSVSAGVAAGPGDSASASALFRFADLALYDAKQAGGNCVRAYRTQMGETIEKRFKLETMMNGGLKRGEFKAAFQLKMDMATGHPAGAEALCRWVHPRLGSISPAEFIPVAEETGQIIAIGNMMLHEACKFAVKVNHASERVLVIAVNVSPRQLMNGDFLIRLRDCLAGTGCQPEWLELEITESLLLGEGGGVQETLEQIAAMGIGIAIDDFGTGYSALSYLHRFPITALKIDRSFMSGICSDPQQEILVRTILAMAHGLGLETTAEGIETEDVARKLASMNCRFGQGYLWHRPAPADETSGAICGLEVA